MKPTLPKKPSGAGAIAATAAILIVAGVAATMISSLQNPACATEVADLTEYQQHRAYVNRQVAEILTEQCNLELKMFNENNQQTNPKNAICKDASIAIELALK